LGRYHREAQIYLLGCTFDENMEDAPIYQSGDRKLNWGHRIYYQGSMGKRLPWLQNNTNLKASEVDFKSFFGERWMYF